MADSWLIIMINYRQLIAELERLKILRELVETYKTIAATSMKRIRTSVLNNRAFHLGLNKIYQEVKRSYLKESALGAGLEKSVKEKVWSLIGRNKKTVFVLFSANTGLYGEVIRKTFQLFAEQMGRGRQDAVVIGKMGKALFEEFLPSKEFSYFDFSDSGIERRNLKIISDKIHQYEKVIVFYPTFKSFFEQPPVFLSISGDALAADGGGANDDEEKYLFEPSLEKVAVFFETEIFSSLLEQVFNESRLAKLASRMMLLDRATSNIDQTLEKADLDKSRLRHRAFNKKQLDVLSGMPLWEKT